MHDHFFPTIVEKAVGTWKKHLQKCKKPTARKMIKRKPKGKPKTKKKSVKKSKKGWGRSYGYK